MMEKDYERAERTETFINLHCNRMYKKFTLWSDLMKFRDGIFFKLQVFPWASQVHYFPIL